MNVLTALYSHLNASTSITEYSSGRIYPQIAPKGVGKPYVLFHQISNVPTHTMVNDAPIHAVRVQISSRTTSFKDLISLSTGIKSELRDLKGVLGSSNFVVQRIFYDSELDLPEYDDSSKEVIYHRAQDFIIWTTG